MTDEEFAKVSSYNTVTQYKNWIKKFVSCEDIAVPYAGDGPGALYTVTFTDEVGTTWTLAHSGEGSGPNPNHQRDPVLVVIENEVTGDYWNCATAVYDTSQWSRQYWSICSVTNLPEPVTIQRRCCTCGSGSTGVLMDNFVFAINDQWFNDTLAQYVESGAFAARLLPEKASTPNAIPPQWILTLKGCVTTPTKAEVKRKMDVYLETLKEFLTETAQRYKNYDPTQTVKIIAAYNGSEFGIKLEDCNGTIATFVITREICPKAGIEHSSYCVGVDRWKSYTDGNCGVYYQLVKANSEDCGYVPCEPAGRKINTYCEGVDMWAFFTDGNCGKIPVKLHENSEDCGYIPPPKRGTVLDTKCKGVDLYDVVADGDGGTYDELNTPNSPACGYEPCDPAGIEKRRYCEGYDRWVEYSDGKCGVTRTLLMANSPDCGYEPPPGCEPAGKEVAKYCVGNDQWAEYTDGNCGTTRTMIMANSPSCMTPYERSITYTASKDTMNKGDSGTYTWTFSGYPPNTRVQFQVWANSSNTRWANGGDTNTLNEIVDIGSNGTGVFTRTYFFMDSDLLPGGGDVYNWTIDPANNVRSNTVKVTYVGVVIPTSRNAAILTKSRTPTDDPRSGEWPSSAVMIGIRQNKLYPLQIIGANNENEDGYAALATYGWDATPNVPDRHFIEISSSSGTTLVNYTIDTGYTDYRGASWTRDTFGIPAQSTMEDGANYRMRIGIEVGQSGNTNTAYSPWYTFIVKTKLPDDPGFGGA
jgi:hypothetical protein